MRLMGASGTSPMDPTGDAAEAWGMATDQLPRRPETAPPAGSSSRTYLWGGVALVLVGAMLLALTLVANTLATTTSTTATLAGVERIELDLGASGDLEIVGTDGDRVEVQRSVRSLLGGTTAVQDRAGPVLRLGSRCRMRVLAIGCGVSYRLAVPREVALAGSAANGDLDVAAVDGAVDVSTSNGDITFAGGAAPTTLRTSNGRIEVRDARVAHLELTTSNGSVRIEADRTPDVLLVRTSNGRIDVVLPDDVPAVAVDAATSNGRTSVEVATDPGATSVVEARTSNGDISVRYGPGR